MVEQRNDFGHSDDDLTIDNCHSKLGTASVIDLFDFFGADPSPLDRLKALVLSINWEISGEVLRDFNEELASLRNIWGGDPIKAVYLQALEKIGKYICRAQSGAHPDAVKLLPILFADLEKVVQDDGQMSEDTKKELLNEDVRRFNHLKAQIQELHSSQSAVSHTLAPAVPSAPPDATGHDGVIAINRLKTLLPGIDREITEKDLMTLRHEVLHLENIFADSRPKQLFLQGIGTLTAYIHHKKSGAHADAFPLLHDFFAGLEKTVTERLDFPAEKAVLLPLVARFNIFKETIAPILPVEAIAKNKQAILEEEGGEKEEVAFTLAGLLGASENEPPPALADAPEVKLHENEEEVEFFVDTKVAPAPSAEWNLFPIPDVDTDDDDDDETAPVAALFAAEALEPSESVPPEEMSLRDCVNALSDKINDGILDQSYREVRRLRTELGHQPLAAIYLHCIAAIMQHIDQRRTDDASVQALPLLRQILDHFEDSGRDGAPEKIRQSLADDIQAVVSWQQGLLQELGPTTRSWL